MSELIDSEIISSGFTETSFFPVVTTDVTALSKKKANLGVVDIVVIICYIVITFCVGIWVSNLYIPVELFVRKKSALFFDGKLPLKNYRFEPRLGL